MKKITAVLVGAGQRGAQVYAQYALQYPEELQIVAVAEPDDARREELRQAHGISPESCYRDWKELLDQPKLADCAMICTMDTMHYEPTIQALAQGYDVLCEKPMSPNPKECIQMGELAAEYGRILSICHVLRYSPFFTKVKQLLDSGVIGKLVSLQQIENVAYWHQAHSFVRGNWRNSEQSSPMLLQKSCHDMDIMLWLVGKKCERVSSYGSLSYFKEENAPKGSAQRCFDGCAVTDTCPYYTGKIYLTDEEWYSNTIRKVVSLDTSPAALSEALRTGPYGRCVFHCDNDVVDHQVVNLEFEGGVTASFTMCAFTYGGGRTINLMGTRGQIKGDMESNYIEVWDFTTGNHTEVTVKAPAIGHGGSDESMMRDFVRLVREQGVSRSSASVSVQSHLVALAGEASRVTGKGIELDEFYKAHR